MQECGALRDPLPGKDAGWECSGRDLIVVSFWTSSAERVPIVLPRRALEIIDPESWWDLPVRDFTGGDHVHLCVPRRPHSFRGDAVMISGDRAYSMQFVGMAAPGQSFMGAL